MRSNEIAQLAGVTVRTLRHYHAVGLLPEPPRSENGYRDYGVADLARLLRIKRLASLGFSLGDIGDVIARMDDPQDASGGDGTAADQLDSLDRELALQIERLEEQRRTIALLKREQLDPDLPVRFARAAKVLIGDAAPDDSPTADINRTALLIAGHLYGEDDLAEFERVTLALSERGLLEEARILERRCDELAADAPERERAAIVADAVALLDPLIDCFDAANWSREDTPAERLIDRYERSVLNEAQQDVTDRIVEAIYDRLVTDSSQGATPSLDPDATS